MEILTGIAIVALCGANLLWLRAYENQQKAFASERRELITRITHPEVIPVNDDPLPPDEEFLTANVDDEYAMVGEIEPGEDNG